MKRTLLLALVFTLLFTAHGVAAEKKAKPKAHKPAITQKIPEVSRKERNDCMKRAVATQDGKPKPDKKAAFDFFKACMKQKQDALIAEQVKQEKDEKSSRP